MEFIPTICAGLLLCIACDTEAGSQTSVINSYLTAEMRILDCCYLQDRKHTIICTQSNRGNHEIQISELRGDTLSVLAKPLILDDCDFCQAKLHINGDQIKLLVTCNLSVIGGAELTRRSRVTLLNLHNGSLELESSCVVAIEGDEYRSIVDKEGKSLTICHRKMGATHSVAYYTNCRPPYLIETFAEVISTKFTPDCELVLLTEWGVSIAGYRRLAPFDVKLNFKNEGFEIVCSRAVDNVFACVVERKVGGSVLSRKLIQKDLNEIGSRVFELKIPPRTRVVDIYPDSISTCKILIEKSDTMQCQLLSTDFHNLETLVIPSTQQSYLLGSRFVRGSSGNKVWGLSGGNR